MPVLKHLKQTNKQKYKKNKKETTTKKTTTSNQQSQQTQCKIVVVRMLRGDN